MKVKINLITYNNGYGLTKDINILQKSINELYKKKNNIEIKCVHFYDYKAPEADINIFLEIFSNILFSKAKYNILIPNQEWYYKSWVDYIPQFDEIWVKTNYAREIFSSFTKKDKIRLIRWRSEDYKVKADKDYGHYLHLCGKSVYKQTQKIVDYWKKEYPKLTIVYSPKDVKLDTKQQDNIRYVPTRISDKDLVYLMNDCGVHLCCSEIEGFGHYIQEAKACKAVVISTDGEPMKSFINDGKSGFLIKSKKKSLKNTLGSSFHIEENSFDDVIKKVMNTKVEDLRMIGKYARDEYVDQQKEFYDNLKINLNRVIENLKEIPRTVFSKMNREELPHVSIVTPTYNRKNIFKLAVLNYLSIDYPRDKLEWVILDDGDTDQKVSNMLPDIGNIKYYSFEKKMNIGEKRNKGVELSSNEIIVFMDDDDYYPPTSVWIRVNYLLQSKKECLTCTTIGCFHINKLISIINVPPHQLPFEKRISEATLTFKKDFWKKQKFNDESVGGEANEFLKKRVKDCFEVSWEGIIVSLLHRSNTSDRVTVTDTPNGCHFGLSDELFTFITNLDGESLSSEDTAHEYFNKLKKQYV